MIKKEVIIGFIIGLIANIIGLFLSVQLFGGGDGFLETIRQAVSNDFFTKLVSLGAVLNLVVFFIFILKKQDYRARGVLLATIFVAVFTFIFKFI